MRRFALSALLVACALAGVPALASAQDGSSVSSSNFPYFRRVTIGATQAGTEVKDAVMDSAATAAQVVRTSVAAVANVTQPVAMAATSSIPKIGANLVPDRDQALPGDIVTYCVCVENVYTGTLPAFEMAFFFDPSSMTVIDAGGGTIEGDHVRFAVQALGSGQLWKRVVKVRVSDRAAVGSSLRTYASMILNGAIEPACVKHDLIVSAPAVVPVPVQPVVERRMARILSVIDARISVDRAEAFAGEEAVFCISLSDLGNGRARNHRYTFLYDPRLIWIVDADGGQDAGWGKIRYMSYPSDFDATCAHRIRVRLAENLRKGSTIYGYVALDGDRATMAIQSVEQRFIAPANVRMIDGVSVRTDGMLTYLGGAVPADLQVIIDEALPGMRMDGVLIGGSLPSVGLRGLDLRDRAQVITLRELPQTGADLASHVSAILAMLTVAPSADASLPIAVMGSVALSGTGIGMGIGRRIFKRR
jgi:hypothetical protein